jgi:uroporphyrinogen III methyltransferase/synthase
LNPKVGFVSLVGAGPGDPGLVTVKALRRIREADVIVYDYLAPPLLLEYAPEHAERIPAGKSAGTKCMPQERIQELLVDRALEGKRVVRLKGGDPYVFGRGGEEGRRLHEAGVPFEVVPGVSSVTGVTAYAGIPATDRNVSSSLLVVTGHEAPGRAEERVRWQRCAESTDTLVVLMGTRKLGAICQMLIAHGRDPKTPAALISRGMAAEQRSIVADLGTLEAEAAALDGVAPGIIVVGDVVQWAGALGFYERLPLFGLRVLVTRPRDEALAMAEELALLGAEPSVAPVIRTVDPPDWAAADEALGQLGTYDWVVFTSPRAVEAFTSRLFARGLDVRALAGVRIAAIGPATVTALEARGLRADKVPERFVAESLVQAFGDELGRARFLLPRALEARDVLPAAVQAAGGAISVVPVYRTVGPSVAEAERIAESVADRPPHVVVFSSASTVRHLVRVLGGSEAARAALGGALAACIGPATSAAARAHGFDVVVEPEEHTGEGLLRALCAWGEARDKAR